MMERFTVSVQVEFSLTGQHFLMAQGLYFFSQVSALLPYLHIPIFQSKET